MTTEDEKALAEIARREAFTTSVVRAGNLDPAEYNYERIETVKKMSAPAAKSVHELAEYLGFCSRYGLDPTKHAWLIDTKRGLQVEVSRDGWMRILNRQPDYAGMDTGVVRKGEAFEIVRREGAVWVNHTTTAATAGAQIVGAYCVIHRHGHRPTVVSIPFTEMNTQGPVWKNQPGLMALTRAIAFAAKTSYGIEAYAQGEWEGVGPPEPNRAVEATRAKLEAIKAKVKALPSAVVKDADEESETEVVAREVLRGVRSIHAPASVEAEIVSPGASQEAPEGTVRIDPPDPEDQPMWGAHPLTNWRDARTYVLDRCQKVGITSDELGAAWMDLFEGVPMDGRSEATRNTWVELATPDNLKTLMEVIEVARNGGEPALF